MACLIGIYVGAITYQALFAIIVFGLIAWIAGKDNLSLSLRVFSGILFLVLCLAFGLHIVPGFNSLQILDNARLGTDALPYSLYFNFDKALIGLFILGFLYQQSNNVLSWPASIVRLLIIMTLTTTVVIILSLWLGYIRFEIKWFNGLLYWMWANLFFTCIAEEALFRGLLQHQLAKKLTHIKFGSGIAVIVAAVLFGMAHIGGGALYMLLATVAGMGYGAVYALTGRIETSILCHFGLNLIHIIFFTYPAIA
ncbi:CPBP family intramembrane metalloprotease [Beggiatoa alba]|nr:CPBP family intramembrane metalloprotease [Beggiatoa alba]